jgi:hypothetical protein
MRIPAFVAAVLSACLASVAMPARAAELKLLLPLGRTAYQTNEIIDLSVLRSDKQPLAAGDLRLDAQGADGSRLGFTFAVPKVEAAAGAARGVAHLHLNGWLLRPGKYTVTVACDGATATTSLDVHSHIRRSSFRLVNWGGRATGAKRLAEGEDNLGYNLFNGGQDDDNLIRAGTDYMSNCTMSGGHQMDLRMECDWSDPLVVQGGTRRVTRQAMKDRTRPNVLGVHFYDEPGLTWMKDPQNPKQLTPHGIPSQVQAYEAAFGKPPIAFSKVDAKDPESVRQWRHWARWKLGIMDAAWQDAQFGVSAVRPDYLSATQSQYGYSAFTDGYYFNVVRSLPVISGHGGYHDFGPGYFNPSQFLEFARARDFARPNWYLPTWYGNTTPDEFRLEQYLSFQTNIQGLMSPPDLDPFDPDKSKAAQGIVESNHLGGRLGTIFTTMPVTRPPVALLFSLSQLIHSQARDRIAYAHETEHGRKVGFAYLAGKLLQQQFMVVLDEDVRDGTLAANHKAVLLVSLDYLDPEVIAGLEAFVKQGGLVIRTADCKVKVEGAVTLAVTPRFPQEEKINELTKAKKYQEMAPLVTLRESLKGARVLADALKPVLDKANIAPIFQSSEPGIVATRQADGDIEYLFAVNATHDPQGSPMLGVKAVTATIGLGSDGRPVYDAIVGGAVKEFDRKGDRLQGQFRFGPGQMRVWARTARPIGTVRAATPVIRRDYTRRDAPLLVEVGAALLDDKGILLSGSAPLHVRVIDPLGAVRYDVHRATRQGMLRLALPLAINDPPGRWTVDVVDLLGNTLDASHFQLQAVPTCGAAAGATRRAVHLEEDRARVFRFFRNHQSVTIVKGKGDYEAAAQRIVKSLENWNVKGTVVEAASVNKPRPLTAEQARTYIGLEYAGSGAIKPGEQNNPALVGYALRGPAILLGTPEDNPLIKFLLDAKFLPFAPSKDGLPGPSRGYVAWQRDALGANQESVSLIGHDAAGIGEAVGTMYEMLAGLEPLTPLALPRASTIEPVRKTDVPPQLAIEWTAVLPDRIEGLKAAEGKLSVLTHAGILADVQADGKVAGQRTLDGEAYRKQVEALGKQAPAALAEAQKKAEPGRLVKLVSDSGQRRAVAYWGGVIHVYGRDGALQAVRRSPQDVTALAWSGDRLIAGDADGRVVALQLK